MTAVPAPVRVREVGDAALLLEFELRIDPAVNARAVSAALRIRAAGLRGVRDVVPTFRSVAIHFDPRHTDRDELLTCVHAASDAAADVATTGVTHEVPVVYGGEDGPDLEVVAQASGLSAAEVVRRHAERTYRVYMMGFLPGFAYMGTLDESLVAPRRATPRQSVAAGSVGVAGHQTGIYPVTSPGGWLVIGRTGLGIFNATQRQPARFSPGDAVRFVPVSQVATAADEPTLTAPSAEGGPHVEVLRPGLLTTVQDSGRWGHQHLGVPVAGAMDVVSLRAANALVGNLPQAAGFEMTIAGPSLRFSAPTAVAVCGADVAVQVGDAVVPAGVRVHCAAGEVLSCGSSRSGARAYIAVAGGVDVPEVLGSRATHVRSRMGGWAGRALRQGDRVPLRPPVGARDQASGSPRVPTVPGGGARLRVLPGPQAETFPDEAMRVLISQRFVVSPQSDRMGYRLSGMPIPSTGGEMISDATFPGAVQVPPSGQAILLMADRQTTGGYPQLAIVISADMPVAGQLAPGDWIEFELTTMNEAFESLHAAD